MLPFQVIYIVILIQFPPRGVTTKHAYAWECQLTTIVSCFHSRLTIELPSHQHVMSNAMIIINERTSTAILPFFVYEGDFHLNCSIELVLRVYTTRLSAKSTCDNSAYSLSNQMVLIALNIIFISSIEAILVLISFQHRTLGDFPDPCNLALF